MEWEIISFEGMGPIKFGMSSGQVAAIIGVPDDADEDGTDRREFRSVDLPIVAYENGIVVEIEAFYSVPNVKFRGIDIFEQPGREVLSFMELQNGGALETVGTVLFLDMGVSSGRLDQAVEEDHSITAFAKGAWDDQMDGFEPISFI